MTKKSVPVRGDVLTCLYNHGVIVEGVVFREVMTGFIFSPTVLGQDVRVEITPVMSYFTDEEKGSVFIYEARTTVLIPAGKTVAITGNNTDTGKLIADIFSGFTSSAIRGNFYISITPTIED